MTTTKREKNENLTYGKLDPMCRITIPHKMRQKLGLEQDDYLQVKLENGTIILRPMELTEKK